MKAAIRYLTTGFHASPQELISYENQLAFLALAAPKFTQVFICVCVCEVSADLSTLSTSDIRWQSALSYKSVNHARKIFGGLVKITSFQDSTS